MSPRLYSVSQAGDGASGCLQSFILVSKCQLKLSLSNYILACTLSLLIPLYIVHQRAKKDGAFDTLQRPFQILGPRRFFQELFWHLDVVGIILIIALLALILVPLTIAGGITSQWQQGKIIAPLVVGVVCIPIWVVWERTCKKPMVPFKVRISLGCS